MKRLLHKLLRWCPLYRMAVGGYWYYNHVQITRYSPDQFCCYGRNVSISAGVEIRSPEKMKVGDGVFLGSQCSIDAFGGLQIGRCSGLGANSTVLTVDHYPGEDCIPFGDVRVIKPVVIGDCVWVGANVAILPGVTIGEGAIIGMGSVVRNDIPPCAIVVGNPARVVGYRDADQYYRLKSRGAVRSVSARCTRFWISAEIGKKYSELLKDIGHGDEERYFECNRWQP